MRAEAYFLLDGVIFDWFFFLHARELAAFVILDQCTTQRHSFFHATRCRSHVPAAPILSAGSRLKPVPFPGRIFHYFDFIRQGRLAVLHHLPLCHISLRISFAKGLDKLDMVNECCSLLVAGVNVQ